MNKSREVFERGNIWLVLFRFSIATIFSILVSELYNLVDTFFVGRYVGSRALGALVVVFPIQRLIVALAMMVAIGSATSMGRRNGLGDRAGVRLVVENSLYIMAIIMLVFIGLVFCFRRRLLNLLGAGPNILGHALDYLSIIIWSSIFLALGLVMNQTMMAMGDRRISLISTSVGALSNIVIDLILVAYLDMGVRGAALATFISQVLAFLISAIRYRALIFKKIIGNFSFRLSKTYISLILAVGFSAFVVEAEDGILLGILNNLLIKYADEDSLIILGLMSKLSMFMFINMFGIGSGMQPLVAYNYGSGNYKRLNLVLRRTIILSLTSSLLLWGLTMKYSSLIISLFVKEGELIERASQAFRIFASFFPILSIYYIGIFFYQSIARARMSLVLSLLRQILVVLPLSILFIKFMGLGARGAWIAYPIGDLVAGGFSTYFLWSSLKKLRTRVGRT